jgi:ABC-type transport system involved in cytochrome bd biosynthesis fused ATPase/permease subunit
VRLAEIARRFRWRMSATVGLVLIEAVIDLLFPLMIGLAINGLLVDEFDGLIFLGALGVAALVIGSVRRFVDTRIYAGIYETVASELVDREDRNGVATSAISARAGLLRELVEFLENSMPESISAIIGTVGVLVVIAGLDIGVFVACLVLVILMAATYVLTGRRNLSLNRGYNDELERQVGAIDSRNVGQIGVHFRDLMRWNRQLSDLETWNFAVIWTGVIALLVYAPIRVIEPGATEYGYAFAAILYVFQFVEAVVALPLYVQQLIRLREISDRLSAAPEIAAG